MDINLLAPINGTSYGLHSSYLLYTTYKRANVALFPIHQLQVIYPIFQEAVAVGMQNAERFNKNGISLRLYHPDQMAERIGKVAIGYTVFELEKLNDRQKHHLNSLDVIISPTDWQIKVLEENGIKAQLHKVPLGVDISIFKPIQIHIPNKPYQFVAVGKWEDRKNFKTLLQAFEEAFSVTDDVELHLINFSFIPQAVERMQQELPAILNQMRLGYKVKTYPPQFMPPDQLARIYNMCDCGISLSHAEGFDLPLLEMMACGLPVIATNVTGHTEYCDEFAGILIEPSGKEKAFDPLFFREEGQEWASFNFDDIVEALRKAYKTFDKKKFTHNVSRASQFTWDIMGQNVIEVLRNYE